MTILTDFDILPLIAKALNKPCIHFSVSSGDLEDSIKAAPFLAKFPQAHVDGHGIIVCEDDKDMQQIYDTLVGDDGPTPSNPYKGPGNVYALTCGANGVTRNENT